MGSDKFDAFEWHNTVLGIGIADEAGAAPVTKAETGVEEGNEVVEEEVL